MINRIGRYEIQAELGRGGFGRVFRAYDPTVGRLVAIKTLNASGEQDMLTRFRNEAAAAGRLHHPNIVTAFDFGEHDGSPFLVMELLDGEDIERIIANHRPLTLLKRLDVMVQSAAGLFHAHSKGVVHRDVKPANIMLLASGTVKIMDFGIALLTQATADRITPQGSLIGTLPYMAPEQFFGAGSSGMTDIFAYGVTCYKLLTGVHPFQAAELGAMMHNIANLQPAPVRALNPDCPEALEQVINKLLAKSPESRYQSLEDVEFDLEPIILDLRKENVGELLAETRNLIAADQLETAQSMVRQVIEIDPGNRTARELREDIQRQLKDRAVRPRINALLNAGREQLVVRKFDEAIQNFESAQRLDKSNPELHRLIEETHAAAGRARRADRLLEDARQALDRDDLTAAHNNVVEAVSTDPGHAHAEVLLGDVRKRLEQRRSEQRLRDGLNHLRGLILLQSFAEAIEAATRLQTEYPDSTEARQTLERARREREAQARRQQLQAAIAEAKELLKNRRFRDVVDRLAHLQTQFPEARELRDLASYATDELQAERRAQAVAQATTETRSLVAAGNFDAALDRLHRALAEDPGLNALRELLQSVASEKSEHQRKVALQEALNKGAALTGEGRFSEAIERLDAFVRAYGENSALIPLRRQAEEGLERRRRTAEARKLMQDAQAFLDEGQPGPATQVLQRGTIEFPGNPELASLLGIAENSLREQQQAEAISKIISEAESLARAKHFDKALQVIDDGQRKYAAADRLLRCREAIVASQVSHERDRARRLQQQGKPAEALQAIDTALDKGIRNDGLLALKREIESEIQHRRDEEMRRTIDQAKTLLEGGEFEPATRILEEATRLYPSEGEFKTLMQQAGLRLKERQRAEAISTALAEAGTKDIDGAVRLLDEALRQYGPDDALVRAHAAAFAARTAYERDRAISETRVRVGELQQAGRLSEALQAIDAATRLFGEDARLAGLKTDLEAQKGIRQAAIAAAAVEVDKLRAAGQFDQALRSLNAAREKFPGAEVLESLPQLLLREQARAESLALATRLAGIDDRPDDALALLRKTAVQYPGDKAVAELIRSVEEELRKRQQVREISEVRSQAETLLSQGKQDEVIALIERRFANEPAFQDLLRRAALSQLLTIEQQIAARTSVRKRKKLTARLQTIAERHSTDREIAGVAARLTRHAVLSPAAGKPRLSSRTWLAGGIGAAGLAASIAFYEVRPSSSSPPIKSVPVEIYTDPSGASVLIGSRSCVAPDCRFDLQPGRYQVEARLNGYQPLRESLNVETAKDPNVMDLTLQPLPPPPSDDKTAGTGTLVVHTGMPGALVYVDGSARNRTGPSGSITLPLEAKTHEVRVELNGYEKPAARKVIITTGSQQVVNFSLIFEAARLELRGAPAGVEMRAGGKLLGKTDGSPSFVFPTAVGTGDQSLQLTLGAANRSIRQKFSAGQTLRLDWKDVAPSSPPLNAEAIENQDWDRVRSSSDVAQLRGYLASHPTGVHAREAASRIADLAWSAVDQSNIEAVRKFARDNPENAHSKVEARKILDQYDAEQQRVAQERSRQEQAKLDQTKLDQAKQEQLKKDLARLEQERANQERTRLEQSRKQQALNTLRQLDSALQRKRTADVKAIWPSASKTFFDSLRSGQVEMSLSAEDIQFSLGPDRAVALCDLVTRTKTSSAPPTHHRGTVTLRNNGGNWIIETAKFD